MKINFFWAHLFDIFIVILVICMNMMLTVDANLQLKEVLEAQGSQIDIVGDDDLNDSPHRYAHGVSDTKA